MPKIRIPVFGTIGKSITFDPDATVGAQIGINLALPDGTVPSLAELAAAIVAAGDDVIVSAITAGVGSETILETQIADGAILARVASDESITGAWTFGVEKLIVEALVSGGRLLKFQMDNSWEFRTVGEDAANTLHLLNVSGDGKSFWIGETSREKLFEFSTTTSPRFRVYDGTGVDYIHLSHDGGNAILATLGAASLNVLASGIRFHLLSETDASLASTDQPFQIGLTSGANLIIDRDEIMARSNGAAAPLLLNNEGGDVRLGGNLRVAETLYLAERTNADTDVTDHGQVFVKNTSPEEFWFASDDGVEHHVAGGSLAETFGKTKNVDQTLTSDTTLQDDDDLGVDVSNGVTYAVIMILRITQGSAGGDPLFKFRFTQPSGSVGAYSFTVIEQGNTAFDLIGSIPGWTPINFSVPNVTSQTTIISLTGTFTAGADGKLQLQWAQQSAQFADTTVRAGSSLLLISG